VHANFTDESADNVWNEGKRVDRLTVLYYTASGAVHAWEFVYDLSAGDSSFSSISHFISVTVGEQCGASWCGIL
jgi:hypothetical protein